MKWTRWYKFGAIFEYHGPVRHNGVSSPKSFKYKDLLGPLHTDDGFRLRSMERFSQREFPLKISLNKLKCPLFDGDIGCYWIRIHKPKVFKYEYIGRSAEKNDGIRKRLTGHFRELCNLPADPNGRFTMRNIRGYYDKKNNKTKNFRKNFLLASNDIRKNFGNLSDPNTNFFDQYVSIKFISIPKKNSLRDSIKIEGMALAAYKLQFSEFPNLNKIDEAKGLNGFFD
tara:strand:+ start:787 stop:1467 length:681 start_codon:yes stop_codon:yes gene_type:complete